MKRTMKRFLAFVLSLMLVLEGINMAYTPDMIKAAEAENVTEEWTVLGTNDGMSWQTCSDELESQTIKLKSTLKTKKIRFYVTGLFGSSCIIRELEILDKDGNNLASAERWKSKVTVTTNISGLNESELSNLCNGNGGENGFENGTSGWDKLTVSLTSDTEYVEISFESAVDVDAVRIWATYCNDPSWGNAPKSWKIAGAKEIKYDSNGYKCLGDNSSSKAWADEPSNTFECQEITLDQPVWLDKIRLKVTDVYSSNTYRISEFEVFDTNGVNVLASVLTDYKCSADSKQYATNEDGYKRSSLATVTYAEGMPEAKADSETLMKWVRTGDMIINGENMVNSEHWYDRNNAKDNLANDYIEFTFDRPYEIASAKLWSNWCNGSSKWGCAAKSWEIWGNEVTQKITDELDSNVNWSDVNGFTFADSRATVSSTEESKMFSGYEDMNQYRAEAWLNVNSGKMGIYTHVTSDSYYLAVIDKNNDKIVLYKGSEQLAEKYWPVSGMTSLAITVNNNKISVWADAVKMLDYTDENVIASGKYGLYADSAEGYADSIVITPIDVADTLPADYPYSTVAVSITEELTEGHFYVANNGSDSNTGTSIDAPFATIRKAQEAVKEAKNNNPNKNYVVIIRGGEYYLDSPLEMKAEDGGSGLYRVTYAAYKGETPIISGGKKISTEWTACESKPGIYETTLTEDFKSVDIRQLFVNDARATRSREPDVGETDNQVTEDGYWLFGEVPSDYTWASPKASLPEAWADLGGTGVEMHYRSNWMFHRQEVTSFDVTNNKIYVKNGETGIVGRRSLEVNPSVSLKDWMYFENSLEFVDTANEWYYDEESNKLYYCPEQGVNPNELDMVVPCLDKLIDIKATKENPVYNIDFYGLRLCHTTWYMPEDGARIESQGGLYYQFEDGTKTSKSKTIIPEAAINLKYAESINIQDCNFAMLGEGAIKVTYGSNANNIQGNTFTDIGGYGIFIGHPDKNTSMSSEEFDDIDTPRGNVIKENYFNGMGKVDRSCLAIWGTYLNHTKIKNNTINDIAYSGISIGWNWISVLYSSHNNEIESNQVTNAMTQMHDGAGIYVLGSQYNSKMNNNYIADTAGVNLYFDEGTRFYECDGNYTSGGQIFYHMCSKDEMLANGYIKENYEGYSPEDLSLYGCKVGETGDVNYDNKVNIIDLVRLKRYLDKKTIKIDIKVSDIEKDTVVNNKDAYALRKLLAEPKVIPESNYNGNVGNVESPKTDYITTSNLTSYIVSQENNDTVTRICDNNYGAAYDSKIKPTVAEEFIFEFGKTITTETKLRISANYAGEQGPSKIDLYVQREDGNWELIKKCKLNWQANSSSNQYVDIPLKTSNITGLKLVVNEANLIWNHYIISELDLY